MLLLFPIRKDSGNQECVGYLKIDVLISFISTSAGSARVLVLIVAAKLEREKLEGSTGYPSYCLQVVDTNAHLAHLVNNPLKAEMGLLDEDGDSERGKKALRET